MIKTLIGIAIIALLGFGGWKVYQVWDKYSTEKDLQEQQAAAAANVIPEQLAGMPNGWEENFQKANNAAKGGDVKAPARLAQGPWPAGGRPAPGMDRAGLHGDDFADRPAGGPRDF